MPFSLRNTMLDHAPFLNAIRANPADDAPRLIYADELTAIEEYDRAEFIRVQCEFAKLNNTDRTCPDLDDYGRSEPRWKEGICKCKGCMLRRREDKLLHLDVPYPGGDGTKWSQWESWLGVDRVQSPTGWKWFSRGFVHTVTAPLATLIGGQCERCEGGFVHGKHPMSPSHKCDNCDFGRTAGILPQIVRSECAVVEGVRASDKKPAEYVHDYTWFIEREPHDPNVGRNAESRMVLPRAIFNLLTGGKIVSYGPNDTGGHRLYVTEQLAIDDLSAALLIYTSRE